MDGSARARGGARAATAGGDGGEGGTTTTSGRIGLVAKERVEACEVLIRERVTSMQGDVSESRGVPGETHGTPARTRRARRESSVRAVEGDGEETALER